MELGGVGVACCYFAQEKSAQAQPGSLQKTREGRKEYLVKEKKRVGGDGRK